MAAGAQARTSRPLLEVLPELERSTPWTRLGEFPTPVDRVRVEGQELFVKRDDLSSPVYGGNKVRTLEVLFGSALSRGAHRIYSTGAYGSNHALATVLHAPRAGLEGGAILFAQPRSAAARENLRATLSAEPSDVVALPHWSLLPFGMARVRRAEARAGRRSEIMVPGGATPEGALGYVSAAFELAAQVEANVLPEPRAIVVGVGSTCTSAGLLLGVELAAQRGLGWRVAPKIVSARVTPWPVTSPIRIVNLARAAGRLLRERAPAVELPSWGALRAGLDVDGRYLGRGYGYATPRGRELIEAFRDDAGFELDTTYSAKAAACAVDRASRGPVVFWSTKSTAPLVIDEALTGPPRMLRWLASYR